MLRTAFAVLGRPSRAALRAYSSKREGTTSAAEVEEQAAAAEVSAAEFSADRWPDGTPKRYRGREAWKNWIDFESQHTGQTDELNRMRHYFFHVDARGRLWRKELH
eukprot:7012935-Prymnesium_polylepis.1